MDGIKLNLGRHCVETAARLRTEPLIRWYFKNPDPVILINIQMLTEFLENTDFHALRNLIHHNFPAHKTVHIEKSAGSDELVLAFGSQTRLPPKRLRK